MEIIVIVVIVIGPIYAILVNVSVDRNTKTTLRQRIKD